MGRGGALTPIQTQEKSTMTDVVVIGGSGMLGSMVVDVLGREPGLRVSATVRSRAAMARLSSMFPDINWRMLDAGFSGQIREAIGDARWIVNAVGITKPYAHDQNAAEVENAVRINSVFPYELSAAARDSGATVLQIATDCVYSGQKGAYSENDPHDPADVYGKTKSLGESLHPETQCIRCSIIGPELGSRNYLFEWFRSQPVGAKINGFVNHQWNGVTTLHFGKLCAGLIKSRMALPHVQHAVPTGSISKYELLRSFAEQFDRRDVIITSTTAATVIDRTLSTVDEEHNMGLWRAAGYDVPPTVPEMVSELAKFMQTGVWTEAASFATSVTA
jgi:dTDP-4-dehydrorhamnose reductase